MNQVISKRFYYDMAIHQAERLMGQLNRNSGSKSYGCFDRQYWHYATVDFPGGRYQEGALFLWYLCSLKESPYHKSDNMIRYVNAAIEFWVRNLSATGSTSEWFPHENSFVATAFSAAAISEIVLRGKELLSKVEYVMWGLERAARALNSRTELRVANQQSGCVYFFGNLYGLTKNSTYLEWANRKLGELKKLQDREGWFPEYGGPDLGYFTLMIDYLAKTLIIVKSELLHDMLRKAVGFVRHFMSDGLPWGGECFSRNTEYIIPSGFELLNRFHPEICDDDFIYTMRKKISSGDVINISQLDDRYLLYNGYNYFQAYIHGKTSVSSKEKPISNKIEIKNFPRSGIITMKKGKSGIIISARKGGTFKALIGEKVYSDGGIVFEGISGEAGYSGFLGSGESYTVGDNILFLTAGFARIKENVLPSHKYIVLRIFQLTLGRWDKVSRHLRERLRDIMVTRHKRYSLRYERRITFKDNLEVQDTIMDADKIRRIVVGGKESYIYVPSSRYFNQSELANRPHYIDLDKNRSKSKTFCVRRTFTENTVKVEY